MEWDSDHEVKGQDDALDMAGNALCGSHAIDVQEKAQRVEEHEAEPSGFDCAHLLPFICY